jgi:hypothetical protein
MQDFHSQPLISPLLHILSFREREREREREKVKVAPRKNESCPIYEKVFCSYNIIIIQKFKA